MSYVLNFFGEIVNVFVKYVINFVFNKCGFIIIIMNMIVLII